MQEQNIAQMLENPFMQYNHIEIVSVTSDSAVMSLDIRRDTTNIYGYVHGGAFFTMADCCAGLTARSDGRRLSAYIGRRARALARERQAGNGTFRIDQSLIPYITVPR